MPATDTEQKADKAQVETRVQEGAEMQGQLWIPRGHQGSTKACGSWISGTGSGSKGNEAHVAAEGQHQGICVVRMQRRKEWEKSQTTGFWKAMAGGKTTPMQATSTQAHVHLHLQLQRAVPPAPCPSLPGALQLSGSAAALPIHQAPVLLFCEG